MVGEREWVGEWRLPGGAEVCVYVTKTKGS
jgi:hypothetical protein